MYSVQRTVGTAEGKNRLSFTPSIQYSLFCTVPVPAPVPLLKTFHFLPGPRASHGGGAETPDAISKKKVKKLWVAMRTQWNVSARQFNQIVYHQPYGIVEPRPLPHFPWLAASSKMILPSYLCDFSLEHGPWTCPCKIRGTLHVIMEICY